MAKLLSWYQGKAGLSGYTDLDQAHYAYLQTKTGLGPIGVDAVEDFFLNTTASPSYARATGSISDRWKAFYAAKTGLSASLSYSQLENAFYASGANDFS